MRTRQSGFPGRLPRIRPQDRNRRRVMPKPQKTDVIKFARLTWELVRRNSEYQENYVRFLNNEGLSPEDVKPKIREDGSSSRPWNLARRREADFDIETGRVVLKDEAPDPQRCNLAYMMHRWGFACDPDAPAPYGAYRVCLGNFEGSLQGRPKY